jgi:hypothetical protein
MAQNEILKNTEEFMSSWEYCALRANIDSDVKKLKFFSPTPESEVRDVEDIHQTIAQLGEEGWEMISLVQISQPDARVYYFKRPV